MFIKDTLYLNWTIWKLKTKRLYFIRFKNRIFYEKGVGEWKTLDASNEYLDSLPIYRLRNPDVISDPILQKLQEKIVEFQRIYQ